MIHIAYYTFYYFPQMHSESMYELRKLQHQHRPVSEFSSKQQLEQFLTQRRHPPQQSASATATSDERSSSNVAERTRQFSSQVVQVASTPMPESVRLEIQGVFEQQRVSSVLQSPLQQEMNRVLHDGLERRRRRQQRRVRPRHNAHGQGGLLEAIRSAHSRPRSQRSPHGQRRIRIVPPENGQYAIPRRDQSQILWQLRQSPALNALEQESREEIISEVSHLVQQQLVTSALSGEFRGVLELHIQACVHIAVLILKCQLRLHAEGGGGRPRHQNAVLYAYSSPQYSLQERADRINHGQGPSEILERRRASSRDHQHRLESTS